MSSTVHNFWELRAGDLYVTAGGAAVTVLTVSEYVHPPHVQGRSVTFLWGGDAGEATAQLHSSEGTNQAPFLEGELVARRGEG